MIASYRLQLRPEFTFEDVESILPYLVDLGVSHLYLSPITQARPGSTHGYDVVDHNAVNEELGGREGFERLREAAVAAGLEIILDFVPNHSGVGTRNAAWQDVLAYGPASLHAGLFDIDWNPIKPELHGKILLPFLGSPYGEVLDGGEITLTYDGGRFYASYYDDHYALSPASYDALLERALASHERKDPYFDLKDLAEAYATLTPDAREKAEVLRARLLTLAPRLDLAAALSSFETEALHDLLERQFWRLSYWKTAGYEINYRRFFDINGLVALRMEDERVFWDAHRLLGELLAEEGVAGVRIDHVDGLFDPHDYLEHLRELGAAHVWVEKILALGETLPEAWPVAGTTGYEFMNDAMGVLLQPDGQLPLERTYRRFDPDARPYERVVHQSKLLVMETALSSELFRLSYELDRLSEADYHTRDFTLEGLREALSEVVAAFGRYRTYLPHDEEQARTVLREAVYKARQRNPATDPSVYEFIAEAVMGEVREDLQESQQAWMGRFQQYTAPVAAKGVEDTAFYRYLPLVALNEVGGEPDHFGQTVQAFHAHNRFRAFRYPNNLLATATHDHKRGEDTRMRLLALTEVPDEWAEVVQALTEIGEKHRGLRGPAKGDTYLFFQLLVALWHGADLEALPDRLAAYMEKASRESKRHTSWINPDEAYEADLDAFVRGVTADPKTPAALADLSALLARHGFFNSLSQAVLKFTSPGVPDLYQGSELLDLSLVDPDNRRPVDYEKRRWLLGEVQEMMSHPDPAAFNGMIEALDTRAKLFIVARLLQLRKAHPALFDGGYRPLDVEGSDHWIAFAREAKTATLVVLIPRFPETFDAHRNATLTLPEEYADFAWEEVLTGTPLEPSFDLKTEQFALPWAVLLRVDDGAAR